MSVYVTSDQHFGHAAARSFYRRPFSSVHKMDREMIDRWNLVIEPEDWVWHLGDFAVRQPPERVATLLKVLHGREHLVTGNNDEAGVTDCDGWQSVQTNAEVTINSMRLVLCHCPFRTWRNMDKACVNLHGHSHGRLKPLPRQFDVGVDVWGFRPVRLEQILARSKTTGWTANAP